MIRLIEPKIPIFGLSLKNIGKKTGIRNHLSFQVTGKNDTLRLFNPAGVPNPRQGFGTEKEVGGIANSAKHLLRYYAELGKFADISRACP